MQVDLLPAFPGNGTVAQTNGLLLSVLDAQTDPQSSAQILGERREKGQRGTPFTQGTPAQAGDTTWSVCHGDTRRRAGNVIMADQDAFAPGTLNNYSGGADGTITGTFSNGLTRTLGQVALAVFSNPTGLVADTDNVVLSREFIGLITSSTAFQAAGRVISTSSDLLDQLLLIVR